MDETDVGVNESELFTTQESEVKVSPPKVQSIVTDLMLKVNREASVSNFGSAAAAIDVLELLSTSDRATRKLIREKVGEIASDQLTRWNDEAGINKDDLKEHTDRLSRLSKLATPKTKK